MLTPLDARVSDANAEALGVSVRELMGNAGSAVARILDERYPGSRVLFVCGSGNNGGDGFAAALSMNASRVGVALLCAPSGIRTDDARYYYSLLECDIAQYSRELLEDADVIVDCALGTGISGKVREPYRSFIRDANASGRAVVSVDIPSGLGTDTAVRPVVTITFMDAKAGMDESNSGEVLVVDIGIPYEAYHEVGPGDMLRYPIPASSSHKGQNGRLMIIAGGPYFGAPAMASLSALRTGTDIVRLFTPESAADMASMASPVLMVTRLPGDHLTPASTDMLLKESERYDAVLLGPGIGTGPETVEAARDFASRCRVPLVVDADGLTAVRGLRFGCPTVLTPHRREFDSLGGGNPQDIARLMNSVVLLKGPSDTITDGTDTRINRTGTPAMTGAGTGDVLAGCVAGLLSKGMEPFDAACLAAWICGKAGEEAFSSKSYGLIATDIIDEIPTVLRKNL